MKNKKKKSENNEDRKQEIEILKAVAQAWHAHSSSSSTRPTNEYDDCYQRNFQCKPSRFKLEATNKSPVKGAAGANWDFRQSLWDSYEIVTVSKRLERGLVLDDPLMGSADDQSRVRKKRRESKNSLMNLFNRWSSRRFNDADVPRDDNTQF